MQSVLCRDVRRIRRLYHAWHMSLPLDSRTLAHSIHTCASDFLRRRIGDSSLGILFSFAFAFLSKEQKINLLLLLRCIVIPPGFCLPAFLYPDHDPLLEQRTWTIFFLLPPSFWRNVPKRRGPLKKDQTTISPRCVLAIPDYLWLRLFTKVTATFGGFRVSSYQKVYG